jgi:hypothetical protein
MLSGCMTMAGLENRRHRGSAGPFRLGRRTPVLAKVGVVAAILIVLVQTGACTRRIPPSHNNFAGRARSTEALIDSIGVVVHFNYGDTAYGRQAAVVLLLRALGVNHVRDAVPAPGSLLATGLQAAAKQGITATLATGDVTLDPARSVADSLRVLSGSIDAFEGPNEIDNSGNLAWPATLRAYMPGLAAAIRQQAPSVPLIQPSFLRPASRQLIPWLPGLYNEHPYPLGGPPEPALQKALDELPARAIRDGVVFTETGYHNALQSSVGPPPASEQAAAVYLPRLLVTAFGDGVRRTFMYELLDEKPDPGLSDPEQHYGLVRYDLSPKPAFLAIRTLIGALRASPGRAGLSPPGRSGVQLKSPAKVFQLAMMRPDGSQVVAVWRPVSVWDPSKRQPLSPPVQQADLTFGRSVRDIAVWRPSLSSSPVQRVAEASRLRLLLGGDLVLVSFR